MYMYRYLKDIAIFTAVLLVRIKDKIKTIGSFKAAMT